ncbi:MAG: MOSC domain-containing protein [Smithellaceae bacterium]|nr:MOSC domain-containing protein [Smithellaceae bacterium]
MTGHVLSVNISAKKGGKKTPVEIGELVAGGGLLEDGHAGTGHRQLSLLAKESIEKIREKGLEVNPGDFAENITTSGITLHQLPVGAMIRVGPRVLLRVTQIGKECHSRCNIFYQVGDCVMPREGIFAEVLTGGKVQAGDPVEIIPA